MFKNYVLTALRNFWKNKLFALINLIGLAIGLTVFVFANLFANYEATHDAFFENSERIYSIKSNINPAADLGVVSINSTYMAVAPLIQQEIPEIEKVAMLKWTDLIVNREDVKFYQGVHLVDPEFFDIFQFEFLHGNATEAMRDPNSVVITEDTAHKYFGRTNVLGETLTLNNNRDVRVTAVIKNLPMNSHLAQNMFDEETLEMLVNLEVNFDIFGETLTTDWGNMTTSQRIYVRLPEGLSPASLQPRLNGIVENYGPERVGNVISSIDFRRLEDMNLLAWHAIDIPAIAILRFLGFLVLGIACINFINLATAQALGRAREIGIRKTMGASRTRLAVQFLVEAVVISFLALIIAIAIIEYALPAFNSATDKVMTFSYFSDLSMMAFLVLTVLGVGLFSGSFPAFLLARLDASKALKGNMALGKWGVFFRKFLVITQNAFSVFLVITVMVTYLQVSSVENQEVGFNYDDTMLLTRIDREGVNENFDTLQAELEKAPGVLSVSGASQYPFDQSNNTRTYSLSGGDEASKVAINRISVSYNFLETLNIPILAGRQFSQAFSGDLISPTEDGETNQAPNVIISRLAASQFGWDSPEQALGQNIYQLGGDAGQPMVVVGVAEDANFLGFHNNLKPFIFRVDPKAFSNILVKYNPTQQIQAEAGIEAAWNKVLPQFPILRSSLDASFDDVFSIFTGIRNALLGFSLMAVAIATIGLFGLSAFLAERRIREVGIRKTFGASTPKIVRLLTFQFSRPVIWAVIIGWILAGGGQWLMAGTLATDPGVFAKTMVFLFGGIFSLVLAWVTVGANAYRAANTSPVNSLHYE